MNQRFFLPVALGIAISACSGGGGDDDASDQDAGGEGEGESPDGGEAREDAGPEEPPPEACAPGTPWAPGARAWADHTEARGLSGLNANLVSTADLDGDGWSDLVTMDTTTNARGATHVLMNREGTFVDETETSGFTTTRDGASGRVVNVTALGDVDGDGDVDAFTGLYRDLGQSDPGDGAEVMLNDGRGVFTLAPSTFDEIHDQPLTTGVVLFDQDVDGNLDLFLAYWYRQPPFSTFFGQQPQVFRGDGSGGFAEVTDALGLRLEGSEAAIPEGTALRPLFGATVCDVSGDGRPDLLGAAYSRLWNLLWVSDGDAYVEVGRPSGVAGDDLVDYSDDQSYRCFCWDHPEECPEDARSPDPGLGCRGWAPGTTDQPFLLNGNTFSIACGDVDGDGDNDLYTGEIAHPDVGASSDKSSILVNDGTGDDVHFARPDRDEMGLAPPIEGYTDEGGQNSGLWDFDDDGRLDAYLGGSPYPDNEGWVFHQGDDGTFAYVGNGSGFRHDCPHGIAIADFDHDGDQDHVVGTYGCMGRADGLSPVAYYENVAAANNWTSIRLVGSGPGGANTTGIGARVRVTAGGTTRTVEVQAQWGRGGLSREAVAHVGLGVDCAIEAIEVRWPDRAGTIETFTDVRANYRLEIRQGEGRVRYLN